MPDDRKLTQATPAELEQTLAHALRYDGRRAFKLSAESMAQITAAHLVTCLLKSGFVVMKVPPSVAHSYNPGADGARDNTAASKLPEGL
jgi:hypothetical protein